ncbi:glycerol-3-phosphate transporter ATP-binding subunit [compost metagenome]
MNFITGTLNEQGGTVRFKASGVDVVVPEGRAATLRSKGYIGKEVILGIRPEDLHEEPVFLEASPNTIVNANVEVAENLGHEMYLYLNGIGTDTVIARVDGRSGVRDGSNVKLALDMNKTHLFDKETELNIYEN